MALPRPARICIDGVCLSVEHSSSSQMHAHNYARQRTLRVPNECRTQCAALPAYLGNSVREAPELMVQARLPCCRERALDVIAAVCVVIVATRLLLRALPRLLAAIQLYLTDMQVCASHRPAA